MWVDFEAQTDRAVGIYKALASGGLGAGTSNKNKAAATLWGIFLGGVGAHKFYMGSWGWGIVYLVTCWLWIPIIVALIEWVRYILMTDEEFQSKAEAFKGKGPFGFFW
jgi:TM2 domain-containing membrane protein YozV